MSLCFKNLSNELYEIDINRIKIPFFNKLIIKTQNPFTNQNETLVITLNQI